MITSAPRLRTAAVRLQFRAPTLRHRLQHHRFQSSPTSTTAKAKPEPIKTPTGPATAAETTSAPQNAVSSSIFQRLGPLTRAAESYSRSQRKRPWITQLVGTFVVYMCADISAQRIGGREYDPARTGRMLFIGLSAAIPYYNWFVFLARNFNYASRTLSIATKVVVNQLCFTSLFNCYFFGAQALLAGETLEAAAQRLRDTVPTSWANSFKVWPATVAFSLAFLPLEFRSLFAGVVAIGWQTYLSYLNRQAELLEEARKRLPQPASEAKTVVDAVQEAQTQKMAAL